MDYQDNFFKYTTPQECWKHAGHILADYLLYPDLALLFDYRTLDPGYWRNYKQIKDAIKTEADKNKQASLKEERNRIANDFKHKFANLLVEFFQLRLVGSQKDVQSYLQRFDRYFWLFHNLIGDGDGKTPMLNLTYQFLDMLRDYLLRNCPDLPEQAGELNINELMQEVRKLYKQCERNPRYDDLEKNTYTAGILNLLDKISRSETRKEAYSYFLIVPEYLMGLVLYVFMVEHIIFRHEYNKGKAEKKAPSLLSKLYVAKPR